MKIVIETGGGKSGGELKPGEIAGVPGKHALHPEETKNDPSMAKALASLADLYVSDAFGSAHRTHAPTAGVAEYLPSAAGFLMKESATLATLLPIPVRPFVAILGGAKISDKIGVINNLLNKADKISLVAEWRTPS